MKKSWVCCFMALCMMLAGCAGGQQEEQITKPSSLTDTQQEVQSSKLETPSQEPEEEVFSDQYTGTWRAPDAPQWDMNISSTDGSSYAIEITCSGSTQSNAVWQLTGVYDGIWGGIAYLGAKYEEVIHEGEPAERIPVPEREEITGLIYFEEDGALYWIEDFDHAGDELYFVKG